MTSLQPLALAYEVERTLYESSSTWEGIDAHEIPLSVGEVVLRTQTGFAAAMPLRFPPAEVEAPLTQAIEQVEAIVPWCLWVIGPSSQPPDLQQRFEALNFTVRMEWDGLALDDLSLRFQPLPGWLSSLSVGTMPKRTQLPWQRAQIHPIGPNCSHKPSAFSRDLLKRFRSTWPV